MEWFEYSSGQNTSLSSGTFDVAITASYGQSSLAKRYQCVTTIKHRNDTEDSAVEYSGPAIVLNEKG